MTTCPKCNKRIKDYFDYCPECGTEIFRPSRAFIYGQLFELMKLQDNRRQHIDSKAHTYIGLLSIAVSIIVALGGLTFKNGMCLQLLISNNGFIILSVLYVSTVLLFIIGVIFAFRAYHIGSPIIKIDDKNEIQITDKKAEKVYRRLDENWLVDNSEGGLVFLEKEMIRLVGKIISSNKKFNIQKSNNLLCAYYVTVTAIILLLLLCVATILSLYTIKIL